VADGDTLTNTVQVQGFDSTLPSVDQEPTTVKRDGELTIDKADDGSPVVAGETYAYTFAVTNVGPSNSSGGVFTDTLPGGWSYSGGDGSGCTPFAGGFTCPVNPLLKNETQNFTLFVDIPTGAPSGVVDNDVEVKGDDTGVNNSDSEPTTVVREVNLAVTKTDNGVKATAGLTITYDFVVTNNGPSDASGFSLVDYLPSGWSWAGGDCAPTGPSVFACTGNPGLPANGGIQAFKVDVLVPADEKTGSHENDVSVFAISGDIELDSSDNSGTESTVVSREVILNMTKDVSPGPWYVGGSITYTVTLVNNGVSLASGVSLTDSLPSGIDYVALTYSSPDGTCTDVAGVISCSLKDLKKKDSATLLVTLVPTTTGDATNTAYAWSNETLVPATSDSAFHGRSFVSNHKRNNNLYD
jgi:uncharacterized repeat protein (TIGR01451 family)